MRSNVLDELRPLFEGIIKHALDGRTKVLSKDEKARLKEYLEKKYTYKVWLREANKRRPRKKRS